MGLNSLNWQIIHTMPRTNKHTKKKANKAANQMTTTSEEMFMQTYPRWTEYLCDNRNGADAATNNAMRLYMQRPDVASAYYKYCMGLDVSNFNPTAPCPLPPAKAALLREHFPDRHV